MPAVWFVAGMIVLGILMSLGHVTFAEWQEPQLDPPEGGVAPLNVGDLPQAKEGGLRVDTLGTSGLGVGTTPPNANDSRVSVDGVSRQYGLSVSGMKDAAQNLPTYGVYSIGGKAPTNSQSVGVYGKAGLTTGGTSYGVYGETGNPNQGTTVYGMYGVNTAQNGLVGKAAQFEDKFNTQNPTVDIISKSTAAALAVTQNAAGGAGITVSLNSTASALRLMQTGSGLGAYMKGALRLDPAGTNETDGIVNSADLFGNTTAGSTLYVEQTQGKTTSPGSNGANNSYGIYNSGGGVGVYSKPTKGPGQSGTESRYAFYGVGLSAGQNNENQYGIYGKAGTASSGGKTYGLFGLAGSSDGEGGTESYGVYGQSSGAKTFGLYGIGDNAGAVGLYAENTAGGIASHIRGISVFSAELPSAVTIGGPSDTLKVNVAGDNGIQINSIWDQNNPTNSLYATANLFTEQSLFSKDLQLEDDNAPAQHYRTFIRVDEVTNPQLCIEGVGSCALEQKTCKSEGEKPAIENLTYLECRSFCDSVKLPRGDIRCSYDCKGDTLTDCRNQNSGENVTGDAGPCTTPEKIEYFGGECVCKFSGATKDYNSEYLDPSGERCIDFPASQNQ